MGGMLRLELFVLLGLLSCLLVVAFFGRQPANPFVASRVVFELPPDPPLGPDYPRHPVPTLEEARAGLFRLAGEREPSDLGLPLDWSGEGLARLPTYHLHSLQPAWDLARVHWETGDEDALPLAFAIALDHRDHNPLLFPQNELAWGEHPAANRAIIQLYLSAEAEARGDPRAGPLLEAALQNAAFVARRSQWVDATNHGLYGAAALQVVGLATANEGLAALGRDRFDATWARIVAGEFLLEHSPAYQLAIAVLTSRLHRFQQAAGAPADSGERAEGLLRGLRLICTPGGVLPQFGDHHGRVEIAELAGGPLGPFWRPEAGYAGWRGPDAGVVVDLAAHSLVHAGNSVSSVAIYDAGRELGAYRMRGAYRWSCPGMDGVVPEVRAVHAGDGLDVSLSFGEDVSIERSVRVTRGGLEIEDQLRVADPGRCSMPVDASARVEGAQVSKGRALAGGARVALVLPMGASPIAAGPLEDPRPFAQRRVPEPDRWPATLRSLGRLLRSPFPGRPALVGLCMTALAALAASRSARSAGACRTLLQAVSALTTALAVLVALLGAFS